MRAFFICLDHYPYSGACTNILNNLFFEGGLLSAVGEIHVITKRKNKAEPRLENYNGVIVHRCDVWAMHSLKASETAERKSIVSTCKIVTAKVCNSIFQRISAKFFYGYTDARVIIRMLNSLQIKENDIIVPVGGYFSTVRAALTFSKRNKCHLVPYLVDPCSTNETATLKSLPAREALEDEIYRQANRIIVTPIMYCEFAKKYQMNKFVAMEFANVIVDKKSHVKEPHNNIICTYIGRLYAGRNIDTAIKMLDNAQNANNIELRLVGVSDDEVHYSPKNLKIKCFGYVSLIEAKKELENSDVLINIGNTMRNQVPSKVFEYISSRKPILNICQSEYCPTIPYLKKYPLALSVVSDSVIEESIEDEIAFFLNSSFEKEADEIEILQNFTGCTPVYCARQFEDIFSSVEK